MIKLWLFFHIFLLNFIHINYTKVSPQFPFYRNILRILRQNVYKNPILISIITLLLSDCNYASFLIFATTFFIIYSYKEYVCRNPSYVYGTPIISFFCTFLRIRKKTWSKSICHFIKYYGIAFPPILLCKLKINFVKICTVANFYKITQNRNLKLLLLNLKTFSTKL